MPPNLAMKSAILHSPSNWHRSAKCVGWSRLCRELGLDKRDSSASNEVADRGTRIHDYAKRILQKEEGIQGDVEELQLAREFVDFTQLAYQQFCVNHTDVKVYIEENLPVFGEVRGTVDYGMTGKNKNDKYDLVVIDLKTGHIDVDAQDNPQLLGYLAALEGLALMLGFDVENYHGFIFQNDVWTKHKYTSDEFDKAFPAVLRKVKDCMEVYEDKGGDYDLVTGSHCRYCPALAKCPQHKNDVEVVTINSDFHAIRGLNDYELYEVFTKAPSIRKFLDAIDDTLLGKLKGGEKIDGLKLVRGRGRRVWVDEAKAVVALHSAGAEAYKHTLIGVTEGDAALGKKKMEELTVKVEGSLQVALEDDKRAAVEVGFEPVEIGNGH